MRHQKPSRTHPQRRSRGEIDRNYFFGDVLIKSGAALGVALGLVMAFLPFTLPETLAEGMYGYASLLGVFGLIGVALFLAGRHLRHEATHWDFD